MLIERLDSTSQTFPTNQSNFKLSTYLKILERSGNLEIILSLYKYKIPSDAIPNLLEGDSTKIKIVLPHFQRQCHETSSSLYNKNMVVEFHHLFVATLLYYARSIRELRKAHNEKGKEDRKEDNKLRYMVKNLLKSITSYQKEAVNKSKKVSRMQPSTQAEDTYDAVVAFEFLGAGEAEVLEERKVRNQMEEKNGSSQQGWSRSSTKS